MIFWNAIVCGEHLHLTASDRYYTSFPLFYPGGLWLVLAPVMEVGGSAVVAERFSASRFLDECRKYGATVAKYVGRTETMIFKQPKRDNDSDNPLRFMGGAAASKEIWREFEERFDLKLVEGYGLVENGIVTMMDVDDNKIRSIGKETALAEVRIVDDNDYELPPGQIGEIVSRPKIPWTQISEYYKKPQETVKTFKNMWFHMGDLFYMDEEGNFYFVDRKKHSMRKKGKNISSWEVESVINQYPGILESAAVAVKSQFEDEIKI